MYTETCLRLDNDQHLILKLNMFDHLRTDSIPHQKREFLNFPPIVVLSFLSKNGAVLYENIYSIEEIYAVLAFLSKNGVVLYENKSIPWKK
jgi:hypothetical protein